MFILKRICPKGRKINYVWCREENIINYKTSKKLFAKCKRNEFVHGVSSDKSIRNYWTYCYFVKFDITFYNFNTKKHIFNYTPQLVDERHQQVGLPDVWIKSDISRLFECLSGKIVWWLACPDFVRLLYFTSWHTFFDRPL